MRVVLRNPTRELEVWDVLTEMVRGYDALATGHNLDDEAAVLSDRPGR